MHYTCLYSFILVYTRFILVKHSSNIRQIFVMRFIILVRLIVSYSEHYLYSSDIDSYTRDIDKVDIYR
jgi:hypothetical protein